MRTEFAGTTTYEYAMDSDNDVLCSESNFDRKHLIRLRLVLDAPPHINTTYPQHGGWPPNPGTNSKDIFQFRLQLKKNSR